MEKRLAFAAVALRLALSTVVVATSGLSGCNGISPPTGDLIDCENAGGICFPTGDCAMSGGTVPTQASNCYSDQGPTECCMAPAAKPDATSCAGQGGLCAPASDCWPGHGYYAASSDDCTGATVACCIPHAVCGDATIQCCAGGGAEALYVPACDHGKLVCTQGYEDALDRMCIPQ